MRLKIKKREYDEFDCSVSFVVSFQEGRVCPKDRLHKVAKTLYRQLHNRPKKCESTSSR